MKRRKKLNKMEQERFFKSNCKTLTKLFEDKKIIGIDIGTFTTGFYSVKTRGVPISPKKKIDLIERIDYITEEINNLITTPKQKGIAFIEDYAWGLRNASITQLAELGGNVKRLLFRSGIPYMCVAPSTLKKFVFGPKSGVNSSNKKALTMMTVLDRWGLKFTDDNACDAYCLYRFGLTLKRFLDNPEAFVDWQTIMFRDFIIHRSA